MLAVSLLHSTAVQAISLPDEVLGIGLAILALALVAVFWWMYRIISNESGFE